MRSRGIRSEAPSGTAAPAPSTGLDPLQGMTRWSLSVHAVADDPPGVAAPYSGRDLPESAFPGDSTPRHVPSSAFRTPSTSYSSNRLPALFRPVPLMGFTLQSLAPPRKAVRLATPFLSCCFQQPQSSTLRFSGRSRFSAASESCSFRGVRTPRDRRPAQGRCSLGCSPLQGCRRDAMADASVRLPPRTSVERPPRRSSFPVPRGIAVRCGQVHCCQRTDPPEVLHLNSPWAPLEAPRRFHPVCTGWREGGYPPWTAGPEGPAVLLAARLSKRRFNGARLR
jgi:hypothetical protein